MEIKLFGQLGGELNAESISVPSAKDTEGLVSLLKERYPILRDMKFAVAVNQEIVNENTGLESDAEIALLPPYSGG